jgi:hypothetical protein
MLGRRNLAFDGKVRRGPVKHPGTRGKGTFDRVVARAHSEVPVAAEKAVATTLLKEGW